MKFWVARDLNNSLSLFSDKPKLKFINIRGKRIWVGDFVGAIKSDLFPEVTFENSPQEIELKLVNNMASFAEDLCTNSKPLDGEFSKFVDDNFDELI